MRNYLAFDLGASSGKLFSGAFDGERLTIKPVFGFPNVLVNVRGALYWDFLNIFRQMSEGIRKAASETRVDSFGIDSFNNDFSFIDQKGELLFPVRSYRDPRTEFYADRIYHTMSPRTLYGYTGNQIAPFNTLMQLAAMREAGQDYLFEKAHRLLFLPDLLGFALTGEEVTEYTLAAETQMLNWETRDWIDAVLNAYGIPRALFAPITMPGRVTGRAAIDGIPPFDFVSVCEHDTASAFLASPLGANSAIISSGTWSLVGVESPKPVICEAGFRWNMANEGGLPGHHRILRNVMGSWLLQELRRDFAQRGEDFDYVRIQEEALAAEPFQFLADPDDPRFYYPGGMIGKIAEACREISGRAPETPGAYFRLVYESLALKYRLVLDRLEALTGRRYGAVNIVGGGSKDALLAQFTANALGRRIVAGPADATSIGNILVQMLAFGDISSVEQGRALVAASFEASEYLPREEALWRAQYERFLDAFGFNRDDTPL